MAYGDYNPEVEDYRATGAGIPINPAAAAIPGTSAPKLSEQAVYDQYRASNPNPGSDFSGLIDAYKAAGYDAGNYMYGDTKSGNEIMVNGQKRKMTVGDLGQNGTSWYNWGENDGGGNPAGAALGGIGSAMAIPQGGNYAQNTDKLNSVWDQLLAQSKMGEKIDTNDPVFRQQADRYAAQVERSRRNAVADNAEKMSSQMLGGSGAEAVANRGINEQAGQAAGQFEAQLAAKELQSRRDRIQQALALMANMGNQEQQRALTQELGHIDAQLRAAGLASNERIANNNLGFNYSNLEANQNNLALRAALGENF
jgi:hypothetical protein